MLNENSNDKLRAFMYEQYLNKALDNCERAITVGEKLKQRVEELERENAELKQKLAVYEKETQMTKPVLKMAKLNYAKLNTVEI